jgi:hypothetical protein
MISPYLEHPTRSLAVVLSGLLSQIEARLANKEMAPSSASRVNPLVAY